ncbi:MAG: fibronectin type III domain-containing protein, partial [Desulfuromonadales bacterium]|nr:fibronectin type III domain-containing protein [Desulfuromonadales bacterium]
MRWLLLACLTLLVPAVACGKDVSLAWDPNTEPDIAGYKIYYQVDSPTLPYDGTGAREGASPVDVGLTTTATLHGLAESRIYYFTVTAYNSDGYESSFSNLVASDWVPEAIEPLAEAVVASRWFKFIWTDPPAGFTGTYTLYYG